MRSSAPSHSWRDTDVEQAENSFLPPGPLSLAKDTSRDSVSLAVTALSVYTFLIVGRIPDFFPSFRLALVSAGVMIPLALILPRTKRAGLLQSPEVRAVLALLMIAVTTIPVSVWPGGSFNFVVNEYSKCVLFFFLLIHCIRTRREAHRMFWGFLGAALALEIGILFFNAHERAQVTETYDSNDIAFVMVCTFPLATWLFVKGRGLAKYLGGCIAMLAIATIILSWSRGGFVSLVIIGAVLLVRIPSRQPFMRAVFVVVSVLLFGCFASEGYWNRMVTIWGGGGVEEPLSDYDASGLRGARWDLWVGGVRLILENPLLGVGAGVFTVAEGLSHQGVGAWRAPHNSFIQIGAELGIGGLALFVFLLYRAVKNCRTVIYLARQDPQLDPYLWMAHGLEISLYGYIVAGFCLSHGYSYLLYFFLGMSVVLKRLATALDPPERIIQGVPG